MKRDLSAYLLLLLGIGGVSTAALWVRLSGDAATLEGGLAGELAFRRLAFSLPILAVWAWTRGVRLRPGRGEWGRVVVAGLFLGAHFHLWIASLAHLPTATSLILFNLHPVIVMAVEVVRRRYPAGWWGFVGMIVALGGAFLLAGREESAVGGNYLVGVAAAVGSAATMAGYLLAGRSVRETLPAPTYVLGCYAVAALSLGLYQILWAGGSLLPATARGWELSILLAVFPTVLGHTPMNAALSRLPATVVSMAYLGEVIGSSILVWIVIGERIPAGFYLGGTLVAVGILVVTWTGRGPVPRPSRGTPGPR